MRKIKVAWFNSKASMEDVISTNGVSLDEYCTKCITDETFGNYTLDLHYSALLTHESLMNVINNLYDIKTKGVKPQQLVLGSKNLAKLSEDELAIGTLKGWSIS